jgi:hypothetical protein
MASSIASKNDDADLIDMAFVEVENLIAWANSLVKVRYSPVCLTNSYLQFVPSALDRVSESTAG